MKTLHAFPSKLYWFTLHIYISNSSHINSYVLCESKVKVKKKYSYLKSNLQSLFHLVRGLW